MKEGYVVEKHFEPINIFIVFLIGVASVLFVLATINTFEIKEELQIFVFSATGLVYLIVLIYFLRPKKITTSHGEGRVIEKEVIKEVPVIKTVEKEVIKEIEKPIIKKVIEKVKEPVVLKEIVLEKQTPKTKYVGSNYNERYHLRSCRFAGAIKKEFLVEEDHRKYFTLRGYEPCKVCNPDKN